MDHLLPSHWTHESRGGTLISEHNMFGEKANVCDRDHFFAHPAVDRAPRSVPLHLACARCAPGARTRARQLHQPVRPGRPVRDARPIQRPGDRPDPPHPRHSPRLTPPQPCPLCPPIRESQVKTFRTPIIILARKGQIATKAGQDHEAARYESASSRLPGRPGGQGPWRAADTRYGAGMTKRPRVTVVGSLNMDISVTVPSLPGPGMTVLGSGARFSPGGKGGNQAVAAARLGAKVQMVGCVGDDAFGQQLLADLRAEHVGTDHVRVIPGTPSGLAMIAVDSSAENLIVVAPGANREVSPADVAAAHPADVIVISAEIPVPAITAALTHPSWALRILNLAPVPPDAAAIIAEHADRLDWLVVNESEAAALLDNPDHSPASPTPAAPTPAAPTPADPT